MGISNTIPPSRLIQPGVVANTAGRPTSPFTGQAIYQVDTNQMLLWNGTAWVIPNSPAQNPTGLELVSTTTIGTAVSSVTVSNAFSSTYDNYKIMISGGAGSASTGLALRVGSIATNYSHMLFWQTLTVSGVNSDSTNNSAAQCNYLGATTPNGLYMATDILGPNLPVYTGFVGGPYIAGDFGSCVGRHNIATAYTSVTVLPLSGTITGGTIRVYGYRN